MGASLLAAEQADIVRKSHPALHQEPSRHFGLIHVAAIASFNDEHFDGVRPKDLFQRGIHARSHAGETSTDVDRSTIGNPGNEIGPTFEQAMLYIPALRLVAREHQIQSLDLSLAHPTIDLIAVIIVR